MKKCLICGSSQFQIHVSENTAVCQSCNTVYKLSELVGDVPQQSAAPAKSEDFIIEAGTLRRYVGQDVDVVVPDGIKVIGGGQSGWTSYADPFRTKPIHHAGSNGAFSYMSALRSVQLPKSVRSIQDIAFAGCDSLKKIVIPEGTEYIGSGAFRNCTALEEVVLPTTLKSIGDEAFVDCRALRAIVIPKGVTTLGKRAFQNCTALERVSVPGTVKSIVSAVFQGCSALTELDLGEGIERIGERDYHEWSPFDGCERLEHLRLPESLKIIDGGTFSHLPLREIVIPNGIQFIGPYAFDRCKQLEKLTLPDIFPGAVPENRANCSSSSQLHLWKDSLDSSVLMNPRVVKYVYSDLCYGCDRLRTIIGGRKCPPQIFRGSAWFKENYRGKCLYCLRPLPPLGRHKCLFCGAMPEK